MKDPILRPGVSPSVMIFTDLDGTLLDEVTYDWKEAEPALRLCRRMRVPVILVSSKTGAEMGIIHQQLGLSSPLITENGGGILFPRSGPVQPPSGTHFAEGFWRLSLGRPYEELVRSFRDIREKLGWNLCGFSDMDPVEISRLTGLDPETSALAAMREYDEPFIILEPPPIDLEMLKTEVRQRGLQLSEGGRFYHLHGGNDKGQAIDKLMPWYRKEDPHLLTIGLGDSPNDFSMLQRVHHPVLVRSSRQFPEAVKVIPNLVITEEAGPKGWNIKILDLLSDRGSF
ncbi:HAD-IIB family hydrolase [Thermodesulfobacteriota bacterium]